MSVIHVPADMDLQTAINSVSDGDTIEIAPGTYPAPVGGFSINNEGVDFTVRAATPGTVTLDGSGSRPVVRFLDSPGSDYSVVFEGIEIANGLSTSDGTGGGLTMSNAHATFVDCVFSGNTSDAPQTGGGGALIFGDSEVAFFGCTFQNNRATNEGGALRVGTGARATIHDSVFTGNLTNLPGHRVTAAGGAIHATSARLDIADSRFVSNESGCIAGAVYALGDWNQPEQQVTIVNSTFEDNSVDPAPAVVCTFTPVGGAIHLEDRVSAEIHHSRFITNSAEIGGAISSYRAALGLRDSVLRGNFNSGTGASIFGGALGITSNDAIDASTNQGAINRPSASTVVEDSFFQGRFGGTTDASLKGGCIFSQGDTNRTYGAGGVPQMGNAATNRAGLTIRRSIFFDCDVAEDLGTVGTGTGGGVSTSHTALTLEDSLFIDNDATGPTGAGGALRIVFETLANIENTTFAYNTAGDRGGAIQVSGSTLDADNTQFIENVVTDGGNGSAIWSGTLTFLGNDLDTDGLVQNSVFSNNSARAIQELDNNSPPINDLRYNSNQFFTGSGAGSTVFGNSLAGGHSVSSLNSLVVTRTSAPNTDKSTVANTELTTEPELGALLAAPPSILGAHAEGDPPPIPESFLAFAWGAPGGTQVRLFGATLAETSGLETSGSGTQTLEVGSNDFLATITNAPIPNASLSANPISISGGESSDLSWATTAGTFLGVSIDRRVSLVSETASGMVTVTPPATTTYRLCVMTEQGGATDEAIVAVDEILDLIFADGFESGNTSDWSSSFG
ncbi:MAG: hypothetical protein MI919_35240 [Holophagales bacterium]|nr:hypothetical protein [Holophagales bacterium]